MKNLIGKTAIVTGGGRGIGKGCALELARRCATVIVNDRPGSPDLDDTLAEIAAAGGTAFPASADVFTRAGCEDLLEMALQQAGAVDILVSNAAMSHRAPFLDYPLEDFNRVLQATLLPGFNLGQLVARHMVERERGGKMVFISSVHAVIAFQNAIAYNAAKAGLNHMALSMSRELAPHRINVNVIEPGWIDTPGERETFDPDWLEAQGRALPWGRLGCPADIAGAVAYLVSEAADYINGTILRVDGGYMHKDA